MTLLYDYAECVDNHNDMVEHLKEHIKIWEKFQNLSPYLTLHSYRSN